MASVSPFGAAGVDTMLAVNGRDHGDRRVVVGYIMCDRRGYMAWDRTARAISTRRFQNPLRALTAIREAYVADLGSYPLWLTVGGDW